MQDILSLIKMFSIFSMLALILTYILDYIDLGMGHI